MKKAVPVMDHLRHVTKSASRVEIISVHHQPNGFTYTKLLIHRKDGRVLEHVTMTEPGVTLEGYAAALKREATEPGGRMPPWTFFFRRMSGRRCFVSGSMSAICIARAGTASSTSGQH